MKSLYLILCSLSLLFYQIISQVQQINIENFPKYSEYVKIFNKTYSPFQNAMREDLYYQIMECIKTQNCSACEVNEITQWYKQEITQLQKKFSQNPIKQIIENIKYFPSFLNLNSQITIFLQECFSLQIPEWNNTCNISFCQICITNYSCIKCQPQYNLTQEGQCQFIPIIPHCKKMNYSKCQECQIGYKLNPEQNICYCSIEGMYWDGKQCKCLKYRQIINEKCMICPLNCQKCVNQTCKLCKKSYFLQTNTNICKKCSDYCIICKVHNQCLQCTEGYKLCSKPISNSSLNNYCIKIDQSLNDKFQSQNNWFGKCSTGCINCKNMLNCSKCKKGYQLFDDICFKCSQNCRSCQINILPNYTYHIVCNKCLEGFLLNQSELKCLKCQKQGCFSCQINVKSCTQCLSGYFLQVDTCRKCPDNCQLCSSQNNCTKCIKGYTALSNGQCFQCIMGCDQCESNSLAYCHKCLIGTFKDSQNKCENCPKGCLTCDSATKCQSCLQGFYLNKNIQCKIRCEDQNCQICQKYYKLCEKCFIGYKININKTCQPEILCNLSNNCLTCPMRYYISKNNTCNQCIQLPKNCVRCNKYIPSICIQCIQGFYLSIKVNNIYYLHNNINQIITCQKCEPNCRICQSNLYCLECQKRFYIVIQNNQLTGQCRKCHQYCTACQMQASYCSACIEGYELNQHKLCLPIKKIQFKLILDMKFQLYTEKINTIIKQFLKLLDIKEQIFIQILKVNQGSTKIQGYISVQSNDNHSIITLNNQFSKGNKILEYNIIQSSFILNKNDQQIINNMNNALIIFISLGSTLGVLFIIAFFIVRYKINKNTQENALKKRKLYLQEQKYASNKNQINQTQIQIKFNDTNNNISPIKNIKRNQLFDQNQSIQKFKIQNLKNK